jgi:hypothetical protein
MDAKYSWVYHSRRQALFQSDALDPVDDAITSNYPRQYGSARIHPQVAQNCAQDKESLYSRLGFCIVLPSWGAPFGGS